MEMDVLDLDTLFWNVDFMKLMSHSFLDSTISKTKRSFLNHNLCSPSITITFPNKSAGNVSGEQALADAAAGAVASGPLTSQTSHSTVNFMLFECAVFLSFFCYYVALVRLVKY